LQSTKKKLSQFLASDNMVLEKNETNGTPCSSSHSRSKIILDGGRLYTKAVNFQNKGVWGRKISTFGDQF